jgi:hypothetical protein
VQEQAADLVVATAIAYETQIPAESPTALPTPLPTIHPQEVAQLNGPPAGSRYALDSPIAFYWKPFHALEGGQVFALVLRGTAGEQEVVELNEPNLGADFQAHFVPEDYELQAGPYQWHVRVYDQATQQLLGQSEERVIAFTEGN